MPVIFLFDPHCWSFSLVHAAWLPVTVTQRFRTALLNYRACHAATCLWDGFLAGRFEKIWNVNKKSAKKCCPGILSLNLRSGGAKGVLRDFRSMKSRYQKNCRTNWKHKTCKMKTMPRIPDKESLAWSGLLLFARRIASWTNDYVGSTHIKTVNHWLFWLCSFTETNVKTSTVTGFVCFRWTWRDWLATTSSRSRAVLQYTLAPFKHTSAPTGACQEDVRMVHDWRLTVWVWWNHLNDVIGKTHCNE